MFYNPPVENTAVSEALLFETLYRDKGVRTHSQLTAPKIFPIQDFELPRNAIYHYTSQVPDEVAPPMTEALLKDNKRLIHIHHVAALKQRSASAIAIKQSVQPLLDHYHQRNRRFKRALAFQTGLKDPLAPFVINYSGALLKFNRYQARPKETFEKWNDYYNTMIITLREFQNEIPDEKGLHQHFMFFTVPTQFPTIIQIKDAVKGVFSNNTYNTFGGLDQQFMLDLIRLVGPDEISKTSALHQVPNLNALNVVLSHQGSAVLINIGKLMGLRRTPLNKSGIDPQNMQLMIIKFFLNILKSEKKVIIEDEIPSNELPQKEEDVESEENTDNKDELQFNDEEGDVTGAYEEKLLKKQEKADQAVVEEVERLIEQSSKIPVEVDENMDTSENTDKKETSAHDEIDDKIQDVLTKSIESELNILTKLGQVDKDKVVKASGITSVYEEVEFYNHKDHTAGFREVLGTAVNTGLVNPKQAQRFMTMSERYKSMAAPQHKDTHGNPIEFEGTFEDYIRTPPELLNTEGEIDKDIVNLDTVVDKGMTKSTLKNFDKNYIANVLNRDVAAVGLSMQNAGLALTDYQVSEQASVEGINVIHQFRVTPISGPASVVRVMLPKLDNDGNFVSNGVKYRLRKQRFPMPIQKVSPCRVALSSYYGKVFIERSEKRVHNWGRWFANQIRAKSLNPEDTDILETRSGDMYENTAPVPPHYSYLSEEFRSVKTKDYTLHFEYSKRFKLMKAEFDFTALEKKSKSVLMGRSNENPNVFIFIDMKNIVHEYNIQDKTHKEVGYLNDVLGISERGSPLECATVLISGKDVPLGFMLAYDLGIDELLRRLNVQYRVVSNIQDGAKVRIKTEPHEFAIRFMDKTLIFSRKDRMASLIIGGFRNYDDTISEYAYELFNSKDVYYNVLEANKLNARYIREIDLQYQMFIDPITHRILEQYGLPTNYRGLLFKAAELLLTNSHPDEIDGTQMRIRSYERFAGFAYSQIVKSMRVFKARGHGSNYGIDVNPNAVYYDILQDASKEVVHDINPIQELKELEAVTYSGNGGRAADTMVKRTRAFHRNDMGTISEGGVDSGKVGLNEFTSASPLFVNAYGVSRQVKDKDNDKNMDPTQLLSTSSLLSPCSLHDDNKRIVFSSIMNTHIVPTVGYQLMPLRTGYEQVIPHRVAGSFIKKAEYSGKVISVEKDEIVVEKEDGTTFNYVIGRSYGDAQGLTIPQMVVPNVKVGDTVKEGDILAYNPSFFGRDLFGNLAMKTGVMGRIALMEKNETLEDSSILTKRFGRKLGMDVTKRVAITVRFDNILHKVKKIGESVTADDILCIIEDPMTASGGMFDEESIIALQSLGAMTPRAKKDGVIERIDVYYNGDKDDMSESLKAIADSADRRLIKESKSKTGGKGFTGSVTSNFKYDAKPVEPETALLVFYITGHEGFGSGDKCVFGAQMKSTACSVLDTEIETEHGILVDGIFGIRSIYARVVLSPLLMGTTNALLTTLGKNVAAKYLPKE